MRGKFIVLYGSNNLGKTTQAKFLVKRLKKEGLRAKYLKYPVYRIKPSGEFINKILRSGKKQTISEEELQMWFTLNRFQYEPKLKKILEKGVYVVAEDYIGTGLAWGMTKGASLEELECFNRKLQKEDLAILLVGKRFLKGKEEGHLHENSSALMRKNKKAHLFLAKKYRWKVINANQPEVKVAEDIWRVVKIILKPKVLTK